MIRRHTILNPTVGILVISNGNKTIYLYRNGTTAEEDRYVWNIKSGRNVFAGVEGWQLEDITYLKVVDNSDYYKGPTTVDMSACTNMANCNFRQIRSIIYVIFPENLTTISDSCFYQCNKLKSIVLPTSVTRIGKGAFQNCSAITYMDILATTPPTLGSNAFVNTSFTIRVPADYVDTYKTAWPSFASIITALP